MDLTYMEQQSSLWENYAWFPFSGHLSPGQVKWIDEIADVIHLCSCPMEDRACCLCLESQLLQSNKCMKATFEV